MNLLISPLFLNLQLSFLTNDLFSMFFIIILALLYFLKPIIQSHDTFSNNFI